MGKRIFLILRFFLQPLSFDFQIFDGGCRLNHNRSLEPRLIAAGYKRSRKYGVFMEQIRRVCGANTA